MNTPEKKGRGRPASGNRYTLEVHVYLDAEHERLFRALKARRDLPTSLLLRALIREAAKKEGLG